MRLRLPAWTWFVAAVLVVAVLAIPFAAARLSARGEIPPPANPVVESEPAYLVSAGIDGEIFPAFANYASLQRPRDRKLSTMAVTVTNTGSKAVRQRVLVQIPGWSDPEIQLINLAVGETRTLQFAPAFLPRLYGNREIAAATAVVRADDLQGKTVFSATVPVRLRAVQDMYWGTKFKYAPFVAAWITPHDPLVEELLREAKEFAPDRRLPGYESWKNNAAQVSATYEQAKAVYSAMQKRGLSYVKSSMTLGNNTNVSERIRFPRESLQHVSANCIDAAVAYAAVFENLGMDPAVVLVPGHAYIGLREAAESDEYLYIDVALTGRASFETATLSARQGMRRFQPSQIRYLPVADARRQGIFPMPGFAGVEEGQLTFPAAAAAGTAPGQ